MRSRVFTSWMWGDALSLLEQADRLHRQFSRALVADAQCWEPPVDVVEDEESVALHVALPGVPISAITVGIDPGGITISGTRATPAARALRIHRIEIPYGRFERRIPLPMQFLVPSAHEMVDGCLVLVLRKRKEKS